MSDVKKPVTEEQLTNLRESGDLSSDEIAWISGDLVVAENVITSKKRILFESKKLFERKRLLKG
jgi:hypothetical protein